MIFDRLGVSMYNRQTEFLRQANGRGSIPTFRLDPRRLAVLVNGNRTELLDPLTADTVEMAVQVLRTVPGKVIFTRATMGAPAISTTDLAERFRPKSEERAHLARERRQRQRAMAARPAMAPEAVAAAIERAAARIARRGVRMMREARG